MDRRHLFTVFAVVMIGSFTAAPAKAGGVVSSSGAAGVKKNATVRVKNTTNRAYFVLVGSYEQLFDESGKFGTRGTVGWAKRLGAILVPAGLTGSFPVPAGVGKVVIYNTSEVSGSSSADLPVAQAVLDYGVNASQTITKTISPGPVLN